MRTFLYFILGIIVYEAISVAAFMLAGGVFTLTELSRRDNFFTYRLDCLDHISAWFLLTIILLIVQGVAAFRLAIIEGSFYTPESSGWGVWGLEIPINPLRFAAVTLVTVPSLLLLFIILRAVSL